MTWKFGTNLYTSVHTTHNYSIQLIEQLYWKFPFPGCQRLRHIHQVQIRMSSLDWFELVDLFQVIVGYMFHKFLCFSYRNSVSCPFLRAMKYELIIETDNQRTPISQQTGASLVAAEVRKKSLAIPARIQIMFLFIISVGCFTPWISS